jgi:hypothetical protein
MSSLSRRQAAHSSSPLTSSSSCRLRKGRQGVSSIFFHPTPRGTCRLYVMADTQIIFFPLFLPTWSMSSLYLKRKTGSSSIFFPPTPRGKVVNVVFVFKKGRQAAHPSSSPLPHVVKWSMSSLYLRKADRQLIHLLPPYPTW